MSTGQTRCKLTGSSQSGLLDQWTQNQDDEPEGTEVAQRVSPLRKDGALLREMSVKVFSSHAATYAYRLRDEPAPLSRFLIPALMIRQCQKNLRSESAHLVLDVLLDVVRNEKGQNVPPWGMLLPWKILLKLF
jgi:hypothetical protein